MASGTNVDNEIGMDHRSPAIKASVLLPGDNHVLLRWKAKPGSSVRTGETIAYATLKSSRQEAVRQDLATGSNSHTPHKRPTKKRKLGTMPATTQNSTTTSTTQNSTTATASSTLIPIVAPADGLLQMKTTKDDSLEIGWIKECSHPAIMGGLCAVCGMQPSKTTSEKTDKQRHLTVSGGITIVVSEQEAQQISLEKSRKMQKEKKLSLVLDLDHTLVHATADPRARNHMNNREVRTLLLPLMEFPPPQQRVVMVQHFVKLRPHVKKFLLNAMERYEVSVYTAGTRMYAQQVTMCLCRHLVDSYMDQPELDQLRHEHYVATQQLQKKRNDILKQQEEPNSKAESKEEFPPTVPKQPEGKKRKPVEVPNVPDTERKKVPDYCGVSASPQLPPQETVSVEYDEQDSKKTPQTKPQENLDASETLNEKNENASEKIPRKKVSFGALPVSAKTDAITSEQVDSLSKRLAEAERFENQAMELRQRLFGSRIVSRTDVGDLGRDVKSLKRIFPCGGNMATIVDDREDVWAKAETDNDKTTKGRRPGEPPENLLLVRPYHWKPFVGFADVNNASGRVEFSNNGVDDKGSKNDNAVEEAETDVQLLWTNDILERLHKRFYANKGRLTVPQILGDMRQEVLAGKRLVLSGLVPIHKQQRHEEVSKPRPTVVRYAENLGAKVRLC